MIRTHLTSQLDDPHYRLRWHGPDVEVGTWKGCPVDFHIDSLYLHGWSPVRTYSLKCRVITGRWWPFHVVTDGWDGKNLRLRTAATKPGDRIFDDLKFLTDEEFQALLRTIGEVIRRDFDGVVAEAAEDGDGE